MALDTNPVDINRKTTGVTLPTQLSDDVWAKAQEESAIMRLAQRIDLPGSGLTIPVITGDATADFVAETAEKPVSEASLNSKQMTPYKIAVIELFSNEFRRDLPRVYDELARRLPNSIAAKLDSTVFTGTAPGTGFDTLTGATAASLAGHSYNELVAVLTTLAASGAELTGWAMSTQAMAILYDMMDGTGGVLFPDAVESGSIGRVLGAPVVSAKRAYKNDTPKTIGFAGDWTQARYGIVNDIQMAISEEATINDGENQINLWQRNMFAVRVEAEVGFVADTTAFVKLTE